MKLIVAIILLNISLNSNSKCQIKNRIKFQENLTEIIKKVEQVVPWDWFLVRTDSGFTIFYCKTCQEEFEKQSFPTSMNAPDRMTIFETQGPDSISYYGTVSLLRYSDDEELRRQQKIAKYKKINIMKINVYFESLWTAEKYSEVYLRNETLKEKILQVPIYKTSIDEFSDYRFWLPDESFKERTLNFDFYFERLPYTSCWYDYSIFIEPDKPNFYCAPMFVDQTDSNYFDNKENRLAQERHVVLNSLAFSLGIKDYNIVN